MARVTVEDCLEHMENRFALVHAASLRSNELTKGATPVHKCKNREIVTSLREIADGSVKLMGGEEEVAKPKKKKSKKK